MGSKSIDASYDAVMSSVQSYLQVVFDGAHDGRFNMAIDEFILRRQIRAKDRNSILRFYRFNELTMTVGYGIWRRVVQFSVPVLLRDRFFFDPTEQNLSRPELVPDRGEVPKVRRITGGGIVLHEKSDLTYSLVASLSEQRILRKVKGSYFLIHEALRKALGSFGIETELFQENCNDEGRWRSMECKSHYCFESPVLFDVMLAGKKIAGAGQKRTQGHLLHQGSIAWNRLVEANSKLEESEFSQAFSACLGELLGLRAKEISFDAEEFEVPLTPSPLPSGERGG
ncbi:MAG: hypothetical protein HY584_00590 [Candidatus Omnitrophica bacterium]|nr:hypothetical protein [Candidatus Omnitrophota bacterium]